MVFSAPQTAELYGVTAMVTDALAASARVVCLSGIPLWGAGDHIKLRAVYRRLQGDKAAFRPAAFHRLFN